jgi:hypothetical protein
MAGGEVIGAIGVAPTDKGQACANAAVASRLHGTASISEPGGGI